MSIFGELPFIPVMNRYSILFNLKLYVKLKFVMNEKEVNINIPIARKASKSKKIQKYKKLS